MKNGPYSWAVLLLSLLLILLSVCLSREKERNEADARRCQENISQIFPLFEHPVDRP
jgi:hypothetical protein